MAQTRDRKLDVAGAVLAIVLVLAVGLAVFGAIEASSGGGEPTPSANFSAERVNDSHLRLSHAGGDVLRGENLIVTINGRERVVTFPERVATGTSVLVQVRAGRTLRVHWTGDRAARERLDSVQT